MKYEYDNENPARSPHTCVMKNREELALTGVKEVASFDENQVILDTDHGLLMIKGSEMHVKNLSVEQGDMTLAGSIDSLTYSSNEAYRRSGKSWISRLFG